MKLQMTFPLGGEQKTAAYQWDDNKELADNWSAAITMAIQHGMNRADIDKMDFKAIKERDGERCPCCNELL
jgi:hypothetical protein